MLQAKSEKGLLITLADLPEHEIEDIRRGTQFSCPTCNQIVIVKAGRVVVPHFAHSSKGNCPNTEGGEGVYHAKGKLLLFQWLKSQGLDVQLEKYIRKIKQQPDMLLTINNKKIAIEYQCARIPIEQISLRNEGYKSVNISPIWILGATRFKRYNNNGIKVDQYTLQFIHQFSKEHPLALFYFCPETLNFITFTGIYISEKSSALGKLKIQKLNKMIFTDLFKQKHFSKDKLYNLWIKEKTKFRLKFRRSSFGKEREWRQFLYLRKTHLEYLPSVIYLPILDQYKMKTPAWDWQSRLYLEIIEPLEIGATFTLEKCEYSLRNHIKHNHFPLIISTSNPIKEYLQLLKELNYIEELSPKTYTKVIAIQHYVHIEDSIRYDQHIMNELITINKLNSSIKDNKSAIL